MDVIDTLAGIRPGSALDGVRGRRPDAREQAQRSHEVLFAPKDPRGVSLTQRYAVGLFTALLQDADGLAALHAADLARLDETSGLRAAVEQAAVSGRTSGPYGHYPKGPLSRENQDGPEWRVAEQVAAIVGTRLTAALEHAHRLVLHPRDSSPDALRALERAGWAADDIVTLSQIVAFTSFQLRVVAGLRVLAQA